MILNDSILKLGRLGIVVLQLIEVENSGGICSFGWGA